MEAQERLLACQVRQACADEEACLKLMPSIYHHLSTLRVPNNLHTSLMKPSAKAKIMIHCFVCIHACFRCKDRSNLRLILDEIPTIWTWCSALVTEIVEKPALSDEGDDFQRYLYEILPPFMENIAFHILNNPLIVNRIPDNVTIPGLLATYLRLWTRSVRDMDDMLPHFCSSLVLFAAMRKADKDVGKLLENVPDIPILALTLLSQTARKRKIHLRLLEGTLVMLRYCLRFHRYSPVGASLLVGPAVPVMVFVMSRLSKEERIKHQANFIDRPRPYNDPMRAVSRCLGQCAVFISGAARSSPVPLVNALKTGRLLPSMLRTMPFLVPKSLDCYHPDTTEEEYVTLLVHLITHCVFPSVSKHVNKNLKVVDSQHLERFLPTSGHLHLLETWKLLRAQCQENIAHKLDFLDSRPRICSNVKVTLILIYTVGFLSDACIISSVMYLLFCRSKLSGAKVVEPRTIIHAHAKNTIGNTAVIPRFASLLKPFEKVTFHQLSVHTVHTNISLSRNITPALEIRV